MPAAAARLPGWNFRTEFRVSFSLYQFQVHGKKICHGQLPNQNGFPQAHAMYQCTVCFFAGPTMEALLHHTSGLGLIGKYLVMSNSNIQRFIFTEKNRQARHDVPGFTTKMERLFTNRKFYFCSYRNKGFRLYNFSKVPPGSE